MTIENIMIFLGVILILYGSYEFFFLYITKKRYDLAIKHKEFNGTWFEYCCKELNTWVWYIRSKMKFRWFYESLVFKNFLRLKGIILISLGVIILILFFYIKNTEYYEFIKQKI